MADREDQTEYVSGEQHHALRQTSSRSKQQVTVQTRWVGVAGVALVLCAASFWGGMAYGKHHAKPVTSASSRAANGSGSFGGGSRGGFGGARRSGGFGQVTAVSSTSITITNQRTSANTTYSITGSTAITDNGQTVGASDIQTGDTVIVTTAGSGSTTATRILVNPSFGGGSGGSETLQSN